MTEETRSNVPATIGDGIRDRHVLAAIALTDRGMGKIMLPQNFNEAVVMAEMMARADVAVPKPLRGNPGACLAVVMRSIAWEMDCWAVATKTYVVNDQLAYEAQLFAAVIHMRAPIKGRPIYEYAGDGPTRVCRVIVDLADGSGQRDYPTPEIGKITVKNSPLWKSDPDQQLAYMAIRSLARRYFPEIILGVYTPEELREQATADAEADKPAKSFGQLEERAAETVVVTTTEPHAVAEVIKGETVTEGPAKPPQSAKAAASRAKKAAPAEPASGAGMATEPGSSGSGVPTTRVARKTAPDGSYGVLVRFAEPGGFPDRGEIYMIGNVIVHADDSWSSDVERTQSGQLLFFRDGQQFLDLTKSTVPEKIWAYEDHAARPTQTASVQTADPGLDTSVSASDASSDSQDPQASSQSESSAPSSEPQDAQFEDAGPTQPEEPETALVSAQEPATGPLWDFARAVADANDWPQIYEALKGLYQTPNWNDMTPAEKNRPRFVAYTRLKDLVDAGYTFDMLSDLQAWRCYIAWETDKFALEGHHRLVIRDRSFLELRPEESRALEGAYNARMAELGASAATLPLD
jgi:hypothetical protein